MWTLVLLSCIKCINAGFNDTTIPVLSVSAYKDPMNLLVPLIRSLDTRILHFEATIAIPFINKDLIGSEILANKNIISYSINIVKDNIGCATGVNYGLTAILNKNVSWGLSINSDIEFYSNTLRRIPSIVEKFKHAGLIQLTMWCAFVIRAHTIKTTGFFDENFYPAYMEDVDYELRLLLSGKRNMKISFAYKHNGFWQCMDTRRDKDLLEKLWSIDQAPWKI